MSAAATNIPAIVVGSAFGIAFVMGAVAQRTNFCIMGAVADVMNMGDWARMRMWLLAIAVAVAGAGALYATGTIDLSKSIYARPNLTWLSYIVGGFTFGVGMTLASGCGNKTLVRIGGGSLKSLVVLVFIGIAGYMTLKGLFGMGRVAWLDPVAVSLGQWNLAGQDLPSLFGPSLGMDKKTAIAACAAVVSVVLLAWVARDGHFRRSFDGWLGGLVIGACIVAGWYVSGKVGFGENPDTLETVYFATNTRTIESFSFVAPSAFGLEMLMLWSDKSLKLTFGIAALLGVVAGSAAYAIATKSFRWQGFASTEDTANHIVGGILMGFGGVTALGCTIGQGITGLSTLSIGSVIVTLAIVAGCWAAMKYQYWRLERSG